MISCKMKANGYLIFDYSSLNVYVQDFDLLLSAILMLLFWPFVAGLN